jgi:glycosyltransferase involved in cell wall biosynthesis
MIIELSIVIPLLDESALVNELIKRVKSNTELVTKKYEIILIDDGSRDDTWEKIFEVSRIDSNVKGIKLSRNFGHHYAITAGLHSAKGNWTVVMDGDLQDRPEVIPELFKKALEGFDVVFVSRQNRPEGLIYRGLQKTFYALLKFLSGMEFDSTQANYSIISRKVVEAYKCFPESSRFYPLTINWLGFKRASIMADHGIRFSGKPSYTLKKRLKLAFDIVLSFSEKPLRMTIMLGICMSIISLLTAFWIIYKSINIGFLVNGWASLMVTMFFLSGIILISMGVMGIYIGEIYRQVKSRPLYVIDEQTQ